jgi:hypothetical protein
MRNSLASAALAMAALLSATVMTSSGHAQSDAPSAEMRQACSADMQALCSSVTRGGGRIKQCMIDNFDKLSDGCKAAMKAKQMAPR